MGAVPVLEVEAVEVKNTRENLKLAIEGERYEHDVMYPEFIETAKRQRGSRCSDVYPGA